MIRPPALVGIAAAAGVLAGSAYRRVAERADLRRFPPPGRMVDIGGRRLHVWSSGRGTPTVVILSSQGESGLGWVRLQQALARETAVIVYDRGGVGWSEPAPLRRAAGALADELHQLLTADGAVPPFVLVGHSSGGLTARLYAARHPDVVAGLVLVDSSHDDQVRRLARARSGACSPVRHGLECLVRSTWVVRLWEDVTGPGSRPSNGGHAMWRSARSRRTEARESLYFRSTAAEVRAEAGTLHDRPLTVVTAAAHRSGAVWEEWILMQRELAQLSTDHRHVIAKESGHAVHRDDPELLEQAVLELIGRTR